jgi:hypothetical protein
MMDTPVSLKKTANAVTLLIAEIERYKSIYWIAKVMQLQYVQIERMKQSGRCQPHQLKQLQDILADVSRETLQNVSYES